MRAADLLLGIGLDVAHVGLDHGQAELVHHALQRLGPARAGGHLGLEVGQVLVGVAGRIGPRGQQRAHLRLAQPPLVDQQHVVDQHPLLVDASAGRRHGAGR